MTDKSPSYRSDRYWMERALELAQEAANHGEVPVGCVIVKDDVCIASARNEVETLADVTAHAEMLAVKRAMQVLGNKYLHGCTLYVSLEPCPMCAGALVWSKMERIVFAASDVKAGSCGSLFNVAAHPDMNHRIRLTGGILETEAEQMLRNFFLNRRDAQR